eukprot:SAG31_NODE_16861_length_692_cov_1.843170_1_plen_128_part_10
MYEKLRGARYISTLDMKNGYFAVGLHPNSQYLTSFTSPWGTYSYQVLSRGLITSAAHFQHWVETKLRKHGILLEYAPFEGDGETSTATTSSRFVGARTTNLGHWMSRNYKIYSGTCISASRHVMAWHA